MGDTFVFETIILKLKKCNNQLQTKIYIKKIKNKKCCECIWINIWYGVVDKKLFTRTSLALFYLNLYNSIIIFDICFTFSSLQNKLARTSARLILILDSKSSVVSVSKSHRLTLLLLAPEEAPLWLRTTYDILPLKANKNIMFQYCTVM